jgi:hypothetical protein
VAAALRELVGDFGFRLAQNDARLPLALRLRLPRHGVFQRLRNAHVANLHRLHGDAPRIGLLVENALQFAAQHSRSVIICASSCRPIDSRSAVCALSDGLA